jgi:hypothetical protein
VGSQLQKFKSVLAKLWTTNQLFLVAPTFSAGSKHASYHLAILVKPCLGTYMVLSEEAIMQF